MKLLVCGTHCPVQYKLKTNGDYICPYLKYLIPQVFDGIPDLYCDKTKTVIKKGITIPEGCDQVLPYEIFDDIESDCFDRIATQESYQSYLKEILSLEVL